MSKLKRIGTCLAMLIECIENILFVREKKQINDLVEYGVSTVKITYYYQVQATRYNKNGITRITIPTSITVDGHRYDKCHAQRLALEIFKDLSDAWILRATPIDHALYQASREYFNAEIDTMFGVSSGVSVKHNS